MTNEKYKIRSWKDKTVEDLIDYYQTNYPDMSRKEVQKSDTGFYNTVRKKGLQDQVLPNTKYDWSKFTVEDFQNYYNENYPSTRTDCPPKADPSFYESLRRRGLLDKVFKKNNDEE